MTLEDRCRLSNYIRIAVIDEAHSVSLVRHAENGRIYIRKELRHYSLPVFDELIRHPAPGMPRICEYFEDSPILTVIEEYISGDTLDKLLEDHGPYSEAEICSFIHALCLIVSDLHSRKPPIIHRDIKASNIIITPDGTLRLLDLSAARIDEGPKSRDTVLIGTAGYAAPEQYGFGSSSTLTDIYAIGILTNLLLTGFMPDTAPASGRLAAIIDRCTQLRPADRYPDIHALDSAVMKAAAPDNTKSNPALRQKIKAVLARIAPYLPPGLRSGNILPTLFSLCGYAFLFSVCLGDNAAAGSTPLADRIGSLILVLGIIFISGNYLNCQSTLPIARSRNILIRILGILIWDTVFLVIVAFVRTFFS